MNKSILEIIGYTNIGMVCIGGLLIVNSSKKIKLIGLGFYYLGTVGTFLMYLFSGLSFFLSSTIIFGTINTINLFQILKQKEQQNVTK